MLARGRPDLLEHCPVERVSSGINSKLSLLNRNPWVKVPETVLPKLDSWLGNAKEDLKMRKTLIAMLGLVALGLWALPALAVISGPDPKKDVPMVTTPVPLENRGDLNQRVIDRNTKGAPRATLSGTLINQAQAGATISYFLYPGACTDRYNGTWNTVGNPLKTDDTDSYPNNLRSDSLNADDPAGGPVEHPEYAIGTRGPYTASDQSLADILFHVNADGGGGGTRPDVFPGSTNSIWCGLSDPNWTLKYGYPNLTYQILYIDTGAHAGATYDLDFKHNFSSEQNYDWVYLVGGKGGRDPIGQSRVKLDAIINATTFDSDPNGNLLVTWTGSVLAGNGTALAPISVVGAAVAYVGSGSAQPVTATSHFRINSAAANQNRALYFVFHADCLWSNEDGLWIFGSGANIDAINTNDNGALYTDEASVGVADATVPPGGGTVIKGTAGVPLISARVGPGAGQLWQLKAGNTLPTPDICEPKSSTTDLMFIGVNSGTNQAVPGQYNSVVTCTFPIPAGTASVLAGWDAYFDLPTLEGYVQQSEYRIYKGGIWTGWDPTNADRTVSTGALKAWTFDFDEIGAATQADSLQLRYNMQCIPPFAFDRVNCGTGVLYGLLYDNLRLEITTGVPAPVFGIFDGALAQTTFVDGTYDDGLAHCTAPQIAGAQCWPGIRGSDDTKTGLLAVHDNFNSPYGDSLTFSLVTGLGVKGLGINWKHGFENTGARLTLWPGINPSYNALYDFPRVIYRIYDPATTTWSPWDSSELDANAVTIVGGVPAENVNSAYRMNWPPRDKAGALYAGGFKLNGETNYPIAHPSGSGGLGKFLPRGTRIQYYFKAVDINGGASYQFSGTARGREVEDLPVLPGGSIVAPDIIEFDVLPRVYPTGTAGTLVENRKNAVILDLDGTYTRWGYRTHMTVQALRSMGVRFDRYRMLQGLGSGAHIGGHEFAGRRPGRNSNYFPNLTEYSIKDSLASFYRIMIQSTNTFTTNVDEAQDAVLLKQWWGSDTGIDEGDRCIFASGDNYFNLLLSPSGVPANVIDLNDFSRTVFGVAAAANETSVTQGAGSTQFINVRDLFADPAAGPALGTPGNYVYVVDGGCPAPNRFDALTPISGGEAKVSATYNNIANPPTKSDNAAVAYMTETDAVPDKDRGKSLGYGFSIQFVRQGGENMVDARSQILYKFLTGCRGAKLGAEVTCWPCPTNANKYTNWATSGGFVTATYGPLYPIQDGTKVLTGVGDPTASAPSAVNRMKGNFPNPFNPETAIRFTSAGSGRVEVRIYDVAGRLVQTLSKSNVVAGVVNEVRWNGKSKDGADLASGIYFVRLRYPDGREDGLGHKVAIVR